MQPKRQRSTSTVRVLQVEDSVLDAELMLDELAADGMQCESRVVDAEACYVAALDEFRPDIVLSDLSMPGFSGQRALELLRQRDADLPFIFVSGTLGEEAAIEALHRGATDYILKQNPARLASAVRRALEEAEARRASRRAEAELLRAQRFESLAMLAGGLSHDLRNLLQPLLLAGDSLRDYENDPHLARLGQLVRDCGQRGLEMVRSMLSFASGVKRADEVRLGTLFNAFDLLMQGSVPRAVTMRLDVADPELSFIGNHTELQQCLLNLALNAIQAMPDGGQLRIGAEAVGLDAGFFRANEASRAGPYLRISVSDDGLGMPAEVKAHLFEPFFTTKPDGTGLGLLSCKRIVEGHGGVMRVDSRPGEGTRFDLYLPLAEAVAEPREGSLEEVLDGAGESVLVVAEEAGLLSLLVDTLNAWGYRARGCQSGTAALQQLDASGTGPELVVLDADLRLLSARRTLTALMARGCGARGVLLAHGENARELSLRPPLDGLAVVEKPFTTRALLRVLGRVREGAPEAE